MRTHTCMLCAILSCFQVVLQIVACQISVQKNPLPAMEEPVGGRANPAKDVLLLYDMFRGLSRGWIIFVGARKWYCILQ